MAYFLGIDAGATKTNCVLGTETDVLARAQGGSIKVARVSDASAEQHLQDVLASLVQQFGEELADLVLLAMRKGTALESSASSISPSLEPWRVACTGSVIEKIAFLRECMITTILQSDPAVEFLSQPADPPLGALWRAAHISTP